jgi:hypothetical protein
VVVVLVKGFNRGDSSQEQNCGRIMAVFTMTGGLRMRGVRESEVMVRPEKVFF